MWSHLTLNVGTQISQCRLCLQQTLLAPQSSPLSIRLCQATYPLKHVMYTLGLQAENPEELRVLRSGSPPMPNREESPKYPKSPTSQLAWLCDTLQIVSQKSPVRQALAAHSRDWQRVDTIGFYTFPVSLPPLHTHVFWDHLQINCLHTNPYLRTWF